jgi:DNA-directed RNA polymerase specialized sigma24 family protein
MHVAHDDEQLLLEIHLARYRRFVALAAALLGSTSAGEDVVQEAYVRLFARPRRLRDRDAAEAYLGTVVVNLSRRHLRRALGLRFRTADVAAVAYRLADGRSVAATLQAVPTRFAGGAPVGATPSADDRGVRVWCARLPRERLGRPPVRGDRIVASLRGGERFEVAPRY